MNGSLSQIMDPALSGQHIRTDGHACGVKRLRPLAADSRSLTQAKAATLHETVKYGTISFAWPHGRIPPRRRHFHEPVLVA